MQNICQQLNPMHNTIFEQVKCKVVCWQKLAMAERIVGVH